MIPFATDLHEDKNHRRITEQDIYMNSGYKKINYCEFNYSENIKQQILKSIREKSEQMENRNIGFGFIFFNNIGNQLIKRTFKGNFRKIIRSVNKEMRNFKGDNVHVNHDEV